MKKLYALILPLCLLATGACTTAEEPPVDASVPIGFSTQVEAVTKTSPVITEDGTGGGTTKLTKFWVLGLHDGTGSYETYVFQNMAVSDEGGDNIWDTKEPRYWIRGLTYRFAAYSDGNEKIADGDYTAEGDEYPGVNYNGGTFRINGYEAGSRDLVFANTTGVKADDIIDAILDPSSGDETAVPLTFSHLLSMLTFTFDNQSGKDIEVVDIRFTVINQGDYMSSDWDIKGYSEEERHLHTETPLKVTANNTGTSDATFVIPQENKDVGVTFTVNIRENTTADGGNLVFSKRYTASLATGEQTVVSVDKNGQIQEISITNQWYIGYRYNYTATIPKNVMEGAAITLNVSVKPWETEDASVSWGGKDEDDESTTSHNP